jgi:hypothetical protein
MTQKQFEVVHRQLTDHEFRLRKLEGRDDNGNSQS